MIKKCKYCGSMDIVDLDIYVIKTVDYNIHFNEKLYQCGSCKMNLIEE